jgi:hypothetical protein
MRQSHPRLGPNVISTMRSIPPPSLSDHHMPSVAQATRSLDGRLQSLDLYAIPDERRLRNLVTQFCSTMGTVLPYIDAKSLVHYSLQLARGSVCQLSQAGRAQLNIACAHAALVERSADAETLFRRANGLLQGLPIRGSSLELSTKKETFLGGWKLKSVVQALLLLCLYQQNTQRSIASWTYHALAVKAVYQLGLHFPASYEEHDSRHRELMMLVWFAVINQDSSLGTALGRPCLISRENICNSLTEALSAASESLPVQNHSVIYFERLVYVELMVDAYPANKAQA